MTVPYQQQNLTVLGELIKGRAVDGNSNEMPVNVTSSAPGRVRLKFRYWNVVGGRFVQDEAVQTVTSVKPPQYEQIDLVVPSGHVNCCPCPDHSTNYVGVAYKSHRLRLVDANGLPFRSSGESCTVNLAGVSPSAVAGDATLAFARNGEIYRQYDKTVLGVSVRGGVVDLETCNVLNASFGYPTAVCTNLADSAAPDMKLVTDVKLPGGHVHLELSDATAPFAVWYYDRRNGAYRKLLDTSSTPVKDLSMAYWKVLMKRAVDGNSNEMPIYVTSPAPGRVKLRFRYWNVIDGRFVQDEAVQVITSVKPPLLVDYNRDGKIDAEDILLYVGGRLAYFWTNDDTWRYDDAFDTSWVGILDSLGLQDIRNSSNGTVDGRCDLINFLPVAVDVGAFVTNWNANAVYYRLEADSDGVQNAKIAFADVDWVRIGETPFGTDCDIHGNDLHEAPVSVLGAGTNLPPAFVTRTLSGSSTLLMEFPGAARNAPLRLKVYSKADDALLFASSIMLHVGDVSQMVGWLNLRSTAGGSGGVHGVRALPAWRARAKNMGKALRIGCALIAAPVAMCAQMGTLAGADSGRNGFYVWQRHWSDRVEAAVCSELDAGTHDVYVLGSELEYEGGTARWRGVEVPERIWRHPRVTAVFRLPVQALDETENVAETIVSRARERGIRRVQLDADVPERMIARYAELVEGMRSRWPAKAGTLELGATFLPCHLDLKEVRRVLAAIDEPVIQLHGIDVPKNRAAPWALMKRDTVFRALRAARALDGRFKMALPSYAYVLTFNADGTFRRLHAEGLPDDFDLPPGTIREIAAPDLNLLHEIFTSPLRLPAIWFRLPVRGVDRWCLERETLSLLERGERPEASVALMVRGGARRGTVDLVACYRHQIPLTGTTALIDWGPSGRTGEFFPLNGSRVGDGTVHGRLPNAVNLPPFACGEPFVFGKAITQANPEAISVKEAERKR